MEEFYINLQLGEVFLRNGFVEVANYNNHWKLTHSRYPTNFVIVNNGSLDSKGFPAIYQNISEKKLKVLLCFLSLAPLTQAAMKRKAGNDLNELGDLIETIVKSESNLKKLTFTKKTVLSIKEVYQAISLN